MVPLLIGYLSEESYLNGIKGLVQEFRELRTTLEKEGRFQSNALFYFLHLSQIGNLHINFL